SYMCTHPRYCRLEPLLRHSKSFGPSAPIAYATYVSPPDEAVAWPGSSCRMANDATRGVGNSSAQPVDDHVPREWEDPQAKRCGGMERSGSLCGRGCRSAEADASAAWKNLPLCWGIPRGAAAAKR
ncbi:MAG: hypothetical protein KIG28_03240, partial [Bacteroidales bacterium]|nr:hypothetical protein [Bacteroidales bacterium]